MYFSPIELNYFLSFLLIIAKSEASKPAAVFSNNAFVDYARSPLDLEILIIKELDLIQTFFTAVNREEITEAEEVNAVNAYVHKFFEGNFGDTVGKISFLKLLNLTFIDRHAFAKNAIQHPIKNFKLLRRFVKEFQEIKKLETFKKLKKMLPWSTEEKNFPSESDLEESMLSVITLKHTYKLDAEKLIDGTLLEDNTGAVVSLTLDECLDIGRFAIKKNKFSHGIDFLNHAHESCAKSANPKMNCSPIFNELEAAIEKHDEHFDEKGDMDLVWSTYFFTVPPLFSKPLKSQDSDNFKNREVIDNEKYKREILMPRNYTLVGGDQCLQTLSAQLDQSKNGYCFLKRGTHLKYLIGPMKVEIYNENPLIGRVYDVINDSEINLLKEAMKGHLARSQIFGQPKSVGASTDTEARSSANGWINDQSYKDFRFLNTRVSDILGVKTDSPFSAEVTQVAAYTPGGQYVTHWDSMGHNQVLDKLPPLDRRRGDRIVTFMYYMSEVQAGGWTLFPYLRIHVKPVKGSALFWYNLKGDCTPDLKTSHCGCPVLLGTKWIANKWIRCTDQIFHKPCPKDRGPFRIDP